MSTSATLLAHYPGDVVEIVCSKCDRSGCYRKASLVAIHGAEIALRDLRAKMAADCPKMRNPLGDDLCGVHYTAVGASA